MKKAPAGFTGRGLEAGHKAPVIGLAGRSVIVRPDDRGKGLPLWETRRKARSVPEVSSDKEHPMPVPPTDPRQIFQSQRGL